MLLTLIADWLYPADPPPMKRLSKINQLHHPGPVTRPQFMGFTDFLFSKNISFTLPYVLVISLFAIGKKVVYAANFVLSLKDQSSGGGSNICCLQSQGRGEEATKCNFHQKVLSLSSADKVTYRANNTSKLFTHINLCGCFWTNSILPERKMKMVRIKNIWKKVKAGEKKSGSCQEMTAGARCQPRRYLSTRDFFLFQ